MTLATPKRIGGLALATALFVAACGGGSGATTAPATDGGAAASHGRRRRRSPASIIVSGSSTVEPISSGVAELFKDANPGFEYTVEGPGTGDGFKQFCAGETDISDASRAIKDEEAEACAEAGIEYVELKVAIDGLSILTSVNNTAIACLSFADLYALVGPESTGFAKWSDGAGHRDRARLEHHASRTRTWSITGPGEESGTFDCFVELVIAEIAEDARPGRRRPGPTTPRRANDNAIIEGIAGSRRPRSAGSASPSPRRTSTRSA